MLEPLDVLRYGLESMLRRLEWISILECHRDVKELLEARGRGWNADVTIVSCCAPEDIASRVRIDFPASRVLELIARLDPEHLAMAARTHADGYLMVNDITEATLDSTLRALMRGDVLMPLPVANYLLDRARSGKASPLRLQPYFFSPRERDVVALLLEGLSNRQIAERVGISVHSVKRHVSSVLNKVNSPSRAHFVAQMLRDA